MPKFRIHTHERLQEWVAEEKGYFAAEGLDYEFSQVERPAVPKTSGVVLYGMKRSARA